MWAGDTSPGSFRWLDADDAQHSVYAFVRYSARAGGDLHRQLHARARPGYRVGSPTKGSWRVVLDTDDHRFGGSGYRGEHDTATASDEMSWQGQPASILIDLPPLGVVWLSQPSA